MSSTDLCTTGSDGQQRSSVILVKERNDTNLDDPYETVSGLYPHPLGLTSPHFIC